MPNLSCSGNFDAQGRPAGVLSPEAHDPAGREASKLRVPHDAIVRAPGLLPLLYKTSEFCTELCIPAKVLRGWLRLGLPFKRDGRVTFGSTAKRLMSGSRSIGLARRAGECSRVKGIASDAGEPYWLPMRSRSGMGESFS